MGRRLRVLAITSEPPWPLDSGGHIRTFHLLKAIATSAHVRLVCPVSPDRPDSQEPLGAAGIDVIGVPVGERTTPGEAVCLLRSVARREPYVMFRRHVWAAVANRWRHEVLNEKPDVLFLDHLDSFAYWSDLRPTPECPAVIDLHNVYSLLARRSGDDQTNRFKRTFLRRQAVLLERVERRIAGSCRAVFAVSDIEASYFRALGKAIVTTVPNGVDCAAFEDLPTGRPGPPTVAFIGSMSWSPNAAAARFLAREVFPALKKRVGELRLLIIGRNPPEDVRALGRTPGIEVTGTVAEIKPYLGQAALLAVPLDAGGGTRLKILEAFAAGLPVVSTAVGAEGIEAIPGVHYHRAERPDFSDAIARLLNNRAVGTNLAREARALAAGTYDWKRIGALAAETVCATAELKEI